MRARIAAFLRRRLADVALVVTWLVVLLNAAQVARLDEASLTRIVASYVVLAGLALTVTYLWVRSRRRS